ncbi:hypothetical protein ACFL35_19660, partial [Candidatus Riflebacteria bacterium]
MRLNFAFFLVFLFIFSFSFNQKVQAFRGLSGLLGEVEEVVFSGKKLNYLANHKNIQLLRDYLSQNKQLKPLFNDFVKTLKSHNQNQASKKEVQKAFQKLKKAADGQAKGNILITHNIHDLKPPEWTDSAV